MGSAYLSFYKGFKNYPSSVTFFSSQKKQRFLIKPTSISWYLEFSSWTLLTFSHFRELYPPKGGDSMTSSFQKEVCCQIAKGSMSSCVVGKNLEASTSKTYPFAAPDSMIYELKKLSKNLVDLAYYLSLGFVFFGEWCSKNSRSIKTSHTLCRLCKETPAVSWNSFNATVTGPPKWPWPRRWANDSNDQRPGGKRLTTRKKVGFLEFFLGGKKITTFRISFNSPKK